MSNFRRNFSIAQDSVPSSSLALQFLVFRCPKHFPLDSGLFREKRIVSFACYCVPYLGTVKTSRFLSAVPDGLLGSARSSSVFSRYIASFPPPCRCFLRSPLDVTRPLDIIREELPEVHDFVNSCLVELLANESRLSLELTLQGLKNFEKHPMFFELPLRVQSTM